MISKWTLLWISIFFAIGCASTPPASVQFQSVPPSSMDGPDPNRSHAPLVSLEDYQRFDRLEFDVVSEEGAGAGVTGARKLTIRIPDHGQDINLKTKDFPSGLDGSNNSPRKELAA